MTKFQLTLGVAAILALGACDKKTPAENATLAAGENAAAVLDNKADALASAADNTTNSAAAAVLDNKADNLHDAADNAVDKAEAKVDNMQAARK